MNKNAIKKFAIWARRELIERVSQRAAIFGITAEDHGDPEADSINGRLLSSSEKNQRKILISSIEEKGFEQVIEEVAYTWFNRFAALRFMEVNGYLPSHVRVFTNDAGEFKPQILTEAIYLELEGLNMDKVYELENANKTEELFKYLLIVQCNALNNILPGMFQRIDDYTELLLPDNLLREGSVIERLVVQGASDSIPESDWTDQVQIIGWLYESYNTERNEIVYNGSLSKERITKDFLPAATTIFTPDWPVHYMVENSLGKLWLEGHPNDSLKSEWKYYLEAEQEEVVEVELEKKRKEYAKLKPEEIRVIDPCSGSGHVLCVLFDTLVRIYEEQGYTARDAVSSIVENNLWGIDVDDRATQLSYFAVMMKARQYDRRFFYRNITPHIYSIKETKSLNEDLVNILQLGDFPLDNDCTAILKYLTEVFVDAKEYGSILKLDSYDYTELKKRWHDIVSTTNESPIWLSSVYDRVQMIINQAIALTQKYHVVVTNPPYLGNSRFSYALDKYVKKYYSEVKSDLSMVMYKHAIDDMVINNGFVSFITTTSWMFLSSFEKLREYANNSVTLSSLVDFGTELFDGKVGHNPIVSWVVTKCKISTNFTSVRLVDYCYSRRNEKETEFFNTNNRYTTKQDNFSKIPGSPIAYWACKEYLDACKSGITISSLSSPKTGMTTGDNDRFLRLWGEVSFNKLFLFATNKEDAQKSGAIWFPYLKGGDFRRWYGNNSYVINWFNDGYEIKNNIKSNGFKAASVRSEQLYFKPLISWSSVSSGTFACRLNTGGALFDSGGSSLFIETNRLFILALLNSKIGQYALNLTNPTINYQPGDIAGIPLCISHVSDIEEYAQNCVIISKADWDAFESSWDFRYHPLLPKAFDKKLIVGVKHEEQGGASTFLSEYYKLWKQECDDRFFLMKKTEEELNRIFIEIYGLQTELIPEVEEKNITVRKADLQRDIRSFISYAVGCMFGRYSLDIPGLIYAGGTWDPSKYITFPADEDAILPICDDEYFEDDIVGLFISFVEKVYGKETLEENLQFIADALGGKGTSREVIRNYFINGFYADHVKVYQKRPIYWLFDSGKKNGFKCLIYLHRYKPDTIARIRTDYIHEQQSRYRTAIEDLNQRIDSATGTEKVKLGKKLTQVQEQAEELRIYEEKIHHLADQMIEIDLDDGVKVNYAKFQDVLAKIK